MTKQFKWLVVATVILAVMVGALLLIDDPGDQPDNPTNNLLINKAFSDVMKIEINNEQDAFVVEQLEEGFAFSDLDASLLNMEYVQQLIADSAYIEYIQLVKENVVDASVYGLDNPVSKVKIEYADKSQLDLWIGNDGPQENTKYVQDRRDNSVYLLNKAATIRFQMGIKQYIDFVIVPPHEVTDIMSTIEYIKYEGSLLERPIVIEKVDGTDPGRLRQAASFGVATHLMVEPTIQKVDLTEAIKQFEAVVGLLGYGVEAYNADQKLLGEYGFNDPLLNISYKFSPDGERAPDTYQLRITKRDQNYYAMVNNNGVIHQIEQEAFLELSYEKIISRWFYSPLLPEISKVKIYVENEENEFTIIKPNDDIQVKLNGKIIDSDRFRKFYNLVVSASHDGTYQASKPDQSEHLMSVEFFYLDGQKDRDRIDYYAGDVRRNNVCFENVCDFVIRDTYVQYVADAIDALKSNQKFRVDWQ